MQITATAAVTAPPCDPGASSDELARRFGFLPKVPRERPGKPTLVPAAPGWRMAATRDDGKHVLLPIIAWALQPFTVDADWLEGHGELDHVATTPVTAMGSAFGRVLIVDPDGGWSCPAAAVVFDDEGAAREWFEGDRQAQVNAAS